MNKYPLIGGSICAVILIVLASLTNVVGFQTVQSSNQKMITTEVDQKELLFQTIVDMANNKEIQRVILGSELTSKQFLVPGVRFSTFTPPVLTEKFLNRMYTMGVILSKIISKSKMLSLLEPYQVSDQEVQKEINAVIEKDAQLKGEMTQLSSFSCGCEKENITNWTFPAICLILYPIVIFLWILVVGTSIVFHIVLHFFNALLTILFSIASTLNCFWA